MFTRITDIAYKTGQRIKFYMNSSNKYIKYTTRFILVLIPISMILLISLLLPGFPGADAYSINITNKTYETRQSTGSNHYSGLPEGDYYCIFIEISNEVSDPQVLKEEFLTLDGATLQTKEEGPCQTNEYTFFDGYERLTTFESTVAVFYSTEEIDINYLKYNNVTIEYLSE